MRLFTGALCLALLAPLPAEAHQKSVSYSKWQLVDDGAVAELRVRWLEITSIEDASASDDAFDRARVLAYLAERLTLEHDAGACAAVPGSEVWLPSEAGWFRVEWRVRCDEAPVRLRSRLFTSLTNHVHLATVFGAQPLDLVLSPAAPTAAIDPARGAVEAAGIGDYLVLGIEHILTGWDHLAFLLLLIVVARRIGDVAVLVTGFTVGHSVTLAAAALGLVVPHPRAVEATIAASILVVALENADMEREPGGVFVILAALVLFVASATFGGLPAFWGIAVFTACYFGLLRTAQHRERLRWAVACLFGLVHGLGFSGVLLEQELPRADLVRSLFGFNVGVEVGQLAIVALLWPLLRWLRSRSRGEVVVDVTSVAGTAIGTLALIVRALG